jgi:NADH-quinone oxidoreductase subunit J
LSPSAAASAADWGREPIDTPDEIFDFRFWILDCPDSAVVARGDRHAEQSKIENRKSKMTPFILIAALTLTSAALAMTRRNLIHSALLLIFAWGGVAGFYLWAGAEFVAFAQVLIYVGAISMVVLFAVLLTRNFPFEPMVPSRRVLGAVIGGAGVAAILAYAVVHTSFPEPAQRAPEMHVRGLGYQLMGPHAASLLVVGVILTAALIGAVVIAASENVGRGLPTPPVGRARRGQETPPYTGNPAP